LTNNSTLRPTPWPVIAVICCYGFSLHTAQYYECRENFWAFGLWRPKVLGYLCVQLVFFKHFQPQKSTKVTDQRTDGQIDDAQSR